MKSNHHPLASIETKDIGENVTIGPFAQIAQGTKIGSDCAIESHVSIGPNTELGNHVVIGAGSHIAKDVHVENGVKIGANSTILPALTLGRNSLVAAGSLVERSVPANAIVSGNPARITGYVNLTAHEDPRPRSPATARSPQSIVNCVKLVDFPNFPDLRGDLCVGEFKRQVPFVPERYFLVYNVKSSEIRGEHAHRECEQFLLCVKGSCSVVVDDGKEREEFMLDSPTRGIYLPPMTWGVQYKYTSEAVLLVFASHRYDPADYIRNYDEFLTEVSKDR